MPGKIIRKETLNKHEQSLWDALQEYASEFQQYHGYRLDDVKKIGVRKFLKMEDWKSPADVSKFMTDALHVSICPNCLDEFGTAEDLFGLCHKCKPTFDLKQMMDLTKNIGELAAIEFTKDKGLGSEQKAAIMEEAAKFAEFAFSRFIKEAALTAKVIQHPGRELDGGTLLLKTVFKKEPDLVLRTENMDRISDLLVSVKHLVSTQLSKVYVFSASQSTEV